MKQWGIQSVQDSLVFRGPSYFIVHILRVKSSHTHVMLIWNGLLASFSYIYIYIYILRVKRKLRKLAYMRCVAPATSMVYVTRNPMVRYKK